MIIIIISRVPPFKNSLQFVSPPLTYDIYLICSFTKSTSWMHYHRRSYIAIVLMCVFCFCLSVFFSAPGNIAAAPSITPEMPVTANGVNQILSKFYPNSSS